MSRDLRRWVAAGMLATAMVWMAPAAAQAPQDREPVPERFEVWDIGGARPVPCPPYDASDSSDVRGGCRIDARGSKVRLRILSVAGDIEFGRCSFNFGLYFDGSGRAAIDILVGGESPCNDVRACTEKAGDWPAAWEARVMRRPGGGLRLSTDACLDTCMGIFEGGIAFDLIRRGRGWRAAIDSQTLGTSGWQLDGSWTLHQSRDVDIRSAG